MRTAVRRRLAAGGGLLSSALVAGLLVTTTGASAAATANPNTVFNDGTTRVSFSTDVDVPTGSTAEFVGPGGLVFTATVNDSPTTTSTPSTATPQPVRTNRTPNVTVDFADPTYRPAATTTDDGPADPGTYTVRFVSGDDPNTPTTTEPSGNRLTECVACLTVLTRDVPTATTTSPSGLNRGGAEQTVTFSGANFARSTVVEVLGADGRADPEVVVTQKGAATPTKLPRTVQVSSRAALGARDVRLVNTDGKQSVCQACLNILGTPFAGVSRIASTNTSNDDRVQIVFTAADGAPFPADARAALEYDVPTTGSSTRQGLRIDAFSNSVSSTSTDQGRTLTALFDLRAAAPGQNAYLPTVTSSSNGVSTSSARFTISQPSAPTVSGVAPASQAAGTAQRRNVAGTGFARGAVVTLTGTDQLMRPLDTITATEVRFVSSTVLDVLFTVPSGAAAGARDVVVTNTDSAAGRLARGYEITAASPTPSATTASPTASPTVSPTASPTPSATPSRSATPTPTPTATATPTATSSPTPSRVAPRLTLPRTTITSQEAAQVDASGEPGSIAELWAYSRPSTTYVRVRRTVLDSSGRTTFSVGPSGNTRMFLRTSAVDGTGSADSPSVVLSVRTGINLKVARTGERTYRFSGSTLPKRRGQTVNVRYSTASGSIVAAKVRVASDGTYVVTRRFTGGGTFTFFTDTGVDINNAAGTSNAVRTTLR